VDARQRAGGAAARLPGGSPEFALIQIGSGLNCTQGKVQSCWRGAGSELRTRAKSSTVSSCS
jgi:hypothetical protein